jgi:hypothetical protein
MINQKFITNALKSNPSISDLANLANALDVRARSCFEAAVAAKRENLSAVVVRMNAIGLEAQETSAALRKIIYERIGVRYSKRAQAA